MRFWTASTPQYGAEKELVQEDTALGRGILADHQDAVVEDLARATEEGVPVGAHPYKVGGAEERIEQVRHIQDGLQHQRPDVPLTSLAAHQQCATTLHLIIAQIAERRVEQLLPLQEENSIRPEIVWRTISLQRHQQVSQAAHKRQYMPQWIEAENCRGTPGSTFRLDDHRLDRNAARNALPSAPQPTRRKAHALHLCEHRYKGRSARELSLVAPVPSMLLLRGEQHLHLCGVIESAHGCARVDVSIALCATSSDQPLHVPSHLPSLAPSDHLGADDYVALQRLIVHAPPQHDAFRTGCSGRLERGPDDGLRELGPVVGATLGGPRPGSLLTVRRSCSFVPRCCRHRAGPPCSDSFPLLSSQLQPVTEVQLPALPRLGHGPPRLRGALQFCAALCSSSAALPRGHVPIAHPATSSSSRVPAQLGELLEPL